MAANVDELKTVLVKYIDQGRQADRLRELLKSTPADVRYNLLMTGRGVRFSTMTGVIRAAYRNEEVTLKLMLAEFTPAQRYEVVRILNKTNWSALHAIAIHESADIVFYLLCDLSHEQRYNILKVQTKDFGDTAMHRAAKYNHIKSLQVMLSSTNSKQRNELLKIKNSDENVLADLSKLPELDLSSAAWTQQDLLEASQKIVALKVALNKTTEENKYLMAKNTQLQKDNCQLSQELCDTKQRIVKLETLIGQM